MEKNILLKAAGLYEKTSAKGTTYYIGRWGGVKVLVLANNDRQDENDPTHLLMIAEAPDRKPKAAPPAQQRQRSKPGGAADGSNDSLDDLWGK